MYLPPSTAGEEILHWNFSPLHRTLLYHPAGRKFTWNRSICYAFRDIDTFPFSAKIQDGRRKWRKMKFFPFGQDTLVSPCGSKIRSKSLNLLRFSRYWHFFIFRKNLRWPPKVAKIEISPFAQETLVPPCRSKICSKSLYLLRFSRYWNFSIFRKNPKWPPKVAKIDIFPLCTGHSCATLLVKNSLEIALSLMVFEIFTLFHFFPLKSKMAAKSGENWNLSPLHRTLLYYPEGLNAIVFKLQVISLMMEVSEKSKSSYYSLIYWDRHPSYSPCCCCGKK